jgi:hypothetical protein
MFLTAKNSVFNFKVILNNCVEITHSWQRDNICVVNIANMWHCYIVLKAFWRAMQTCWKIRLIRTLNNNYCSGCGCTCCVTEWQEISWSCEQNTSYKLLSNDLINYRNYINWRRKSQFLLKFSIYTKLTYYLSWNILNVGDETPSYIFVEKWEKWDIYYLF